MNSGRYGNATVLTRSRYSNGKVAVLYPAVGIWFRWQSQDEDSHSAEVFVI